MILALDTSTKWVGIAIYDGAQVLFEKIWKTCRRHTIELSPAVREALKDAGLGFSELSAVAVALGPGSFTSLRIGLAVAKGFSLSLHIPVIGVPSLNVTAYGQPLSENAMICVLKAGRGRFAAQDYLVVEDNWQPRGDIYAASPEDLENRITSRTIIRGEIGEQERKILERRWRNALVASPAENVRRPAHLAEIAWKRFLQGDLDDVIQVAPIYLHTVGNPNL